MSTIIIGAGFAGLAAAQRLARNGRAVTIIEARDRIGGRVHTLWDAAIAFPVELGAEWYESDGAVNALLGRAGGETTDAEGERAISTEEGWESLDERQDENRSLLAQVHLPSGRDLSLAEALAECRGDPELAPARNMLTAYVEGFHAAHPDRVSARWLSEVEANHPASKSDSRSPTGLHRAIAVLRTDIAAHAEIHLNTIARELRWRRGQAEIHTEDGKTLGAQSVIITVPLTMLTPASTARGALTFTPAINEKHAAAALMEMGPATKMVFRFATPFWKDISAVKDASFFHAFDQPFPTWWTSESPDVPLLTAWAGGPQSTRLGPTDDTAVLDLAMTSLAHALHLPRREIEGQMQAHYYHDWSSDPFSRGAYTFVRVGGAEAHKELARPIENTLFFAGEATCGGGANATMEGALQSGWRAADEVMDRA